MNVWWQVVWQGDLLAFWFWNSLKTPQFLSQIACFLYSKCTNMWSLLAFSFVPSQRVYRALQDFLEEAACKVSKTHGQLGDIKAIKAPSCFLQRVTLSNDAFADPPLAWLGGHCLGEPTLCWRTGLCLWRDNWAGGLFDHVRTCIGQAWKNEVGGGIIS